jgi:LPS export ABC transporter protein LptC/lipopolysaccharide transport protein LptA
MNPRAIRAALLFGVLGLLAAVVVSLRRPGPKGKPDAVSPGASRETRTLGLVYTGYKEGQERWTLSARALRSKDSEQVRLEGVRFSQGYLAQGQTGTLTIEADECVYAEAQERAVFRKNVRITTADGFEMLTDSLTYRGDRGVARTEDPASFRRKDMSGTSTGVDYDADTGKLVLPKDVVLHVNDPDQPPAQIRSRRAVADKTKGTLRFVDDVDASQGQDRLKASQLTLYFEAGSRDLKTVVATGEVELKTAGAGALPGAKGAAGLGQGTRVLKAKRLELRYRPDRSLERVGAIGEADLTLLPGPRDPRERRRLRGHALDFDFDAQGHVERANGRRDTVFTVEPLTKGQGASQIVKADRFKARMMAGRNEAEEILFRGNVSFERGGQRATSERARYTGADELLRLSDDPRLFEDGSQLEAWGISVGTRSGDVAAKRDVRHLLRGRKAAGRPGLLSAEGGTLITSAELAYVSASRKATYTGEALLRSGKDEVRAPVLVIEEDAKGVRTLTASPGVVSRLHPQAAQAGGEPPAPVEGRAQEMVYSEAAGRIVYTGDVLLRQGDIQTKSPRATVSLTPDGRGVDRLVAGDPVEVLQGPRRAKGSQAVYTPANETMLLTGDAVELVDGQRITRGRSLTFHVGDDTILVEGREEGRTETILKKEPSQP